MQTDDLRRGFLKAIQQWLEKATDDDRVVKDVTTSLPGRHQSDGVIVKGPIRSKKNDKATIIATLPSRYDDDLSYHC